MATPTAGSQGFDAPGFRDAIRFAMEMGAPVDPEDQATFYFPTTYSDGSAPADGLRVPFNPSAVVGVATPDPVKVDCAIDYLDSDGEATRTSRRTASRLAITLLDEDYADVKGCAYVKVGGDRYNFRRTEPPEGLFDVGVYVMHFTAEDET